MTLHRPEQSPTARRAGVAVRRAGVAARRAWVADRRAGVAARREEVAPYWGGRSKSMYKTKFFRSCVKFTTKLPVFLLLYFFK